LINFIQKDTKRRTDTKILLIKAESVDLKHFQKYNIYVLNQLKPYIYILSIPKSIAFWCVILGDTYIFSTKRGVL